MRVVVEESNDGATPEAAEIIQKPNDSARHASSIGHNAREGSAPRPRLSLEMR